MLLDDFRTSIQNKKKLIDDIITRLEEKSQKGGGMGYKVSEDNFSDIWKFMIDISNKINDINEKVCDIDEDTDKIGKSVCSAPTGEATNKVETINRMLGMYEKVLEKTKRSYLSNKNKTGDVDPSTLTSMDEQGILAKDKSGCFGGIVSEEARSKCSDYSGLLGIYYNLLTNIKALTDEIKHHNFSTPDAVYNRLHESIKENIKQAEKLEHAARAFEEYVVMLPKPRDVRISAGDLEYAILPDPVSTEYLVSSGELTQTLQANYVYDGLANILNVVGRHYKNIDKGLSLYSDHFFEKHISEVLEKKIGSIIERQRTPLVGGGYQELTESMNRLNIISSNTRESLDSASNGLKDYTMDQEKSWYLNKFIMEMMSDNKSRIVYNYVNRDIISAYMDILKIVKKLAEDPPRSNDPNIYNLYRMNNELLLENIDTMMEYIAKDDSVNKDGIIDVRKSSGALRFALIIFNQIHHDIVKFFAEGIKTIHSKKKHLKKVTQEINKAREELRSANEKYSELKKELERYEKTDRDIGSQEIGIAKYLKKFYSDFSGDERKGLKRFRKEMTTLKQQKDALEEVRSGAVMEAAKANYEAVVDDIRDSSPLIKYATIEELDDIYARLTKYDSIKDKYFSRS